MNFLSALVECFGFLLHKLEAARTLEGHRAVTFEGQLALRLQIPLYVTGHQLLGPHLPLF